MKLVLVGKSFKFALIDSWEVKFQTWTKYFNEEFKRRRGYDCRIYLPVLAGEVIGSVDISERFLHDYRKTISDLISENYYGHFKKLCQDNGLELYGEAIYGGPGSPPVDILKCNEELDVPMSEFWVKKLNMKSQRKIVPAVKTRLQTSASELFGQKIHAAEAFTSGVNYEHDFYELKDIGDRAYCEGVNRFVLHSFVHQPDDRKPGWTMGRPGMSFNRKNTWWNQASGWISYTNRSQSLLQKGDFVADVCYFNGDNIPTFEGVRKHTNLPYGYRYVTCNSEIIQKSMKVENGRIIFSTGNSVNFLVLPERETMELKTVEKVAELVEQGATVIGPRPLRTISLYNHQENNERLKLLTDKVWGDIDGESVTENRYGKGKIIWGKSLNQIFSEEGLQPDFEWESIDRKANLIFIHRKVKDADFYFVANQDSHSVLVDCIFRNEGKQPEIWNPETGEIILPSLFQQKGGKTHLPINFAPRQSMFFVFRNPVKSVKLASVLKDGKRIYPFEKDSSVNVPHVIYQQQGMEFESLSAGRYSLIDDSGDKTILKVKNPVKKMKISKPWMVTFRPNWKEPETIRFPELMSWTKHQNPKIKFYSGAAIYSTYVELPQSVLKGNKKILLELGKVKNLASIKINGREVGIYWKPPYSADISEFVNRGVNHITVEVTNVWRNGLIGDLQLPKDKRRTWTTYPFEDFLNKKSAILESGLIGPVQIRIINRYRFN